MKEDREHDFYKMESELLSGKILILSPAIYDRYIEFVRNAGMKEEAIKQISMSSMFPYHQNKKEKLVHWKKSK